MCVCVCGPVVTRVGSWGGFVVSAQRALRSPGSSEKTPNDPEEDARTQRLGVPSLRDLSVESGLLTSLGTRNGFELLPVDT